LSVYPGWDVRQLTLAPEARRNIDGRLIGLIVFSVAVQLLSIPFRSLCSVRVPIEPALVVRYEHMIVCGPSGATMKRSATVVIGAVASATLCIAAAGDSASSKVTLLHAQLITPASDALFQAESNLPATQDQWQRIVARAGDLVRAASELGSIPFAKGQGEWLEFARALRAGAEQAARAATARDQDALVSANGEIVSACEDCHTKYRDAGRSMKQ
jgi:hypothetical protein